MSNYFIISLPRCGTAWLANAMTWGDSYCYHEGLYGFDRMIDFSAMLSANPARHVGDSDTTLALVLPWLYRMFPAAKYVFIHRNTEDVISSLNKAGFPTHIIPEIERSIKWGISNINGFHISFDKVFTETRRIWDYIGLGDYPQERFEMLRHMKIDDSERFLTGQPVNLANLMKEVA